MHRARISGRRRRCAVQGAGGQLISAPHAGTAVVLSSCLRMTWSDARKEG